MKSWLSKDLFGLSLTSFFSDFCHEMTTSLLPTFVQVLVGDSKAPLALGVITGVADASATLLKLLSGWLADRIVFYKPVVAFGYFIMAVFVSLIGTATSIVQVFMFQVLAWMGKGLREPMRDVWLTNISSPRNYGKVFGFERAFDTLGAIAGPLLAFFTIRMVALRYNFYIAFIPGILSVIAILFLTSNYKAPATRENKGTFLAQFKALPRDFTYFVLVMFVFGIANFNKTLIIYRAQQLFTGQATSSIIASSWAILLYVIFNVVRAISEFGVGALSDYVNRKALLALGFALFSCVSLCMLFAQAHVLVWMSIFVSAGISAGIITSIEKSYAAQLLPENVRGIGFGFLQSVDGLGDLLSSVIIGGLWSYFSPEIAFGYAAALSTLSVILILFVKR